jgi:hypothetical protein
MNKVLTALAACGAVALNTSSFGDTLLSAILTHDQESNHDPLLTSTGDPRPLSFGTATFILNDAQTQMSFSATIFNIDVTGTQTPNDSNDNLVAAHIHVGAAPGANAPVRWGFFGSPDNDINPDQLVVTPFANGVGGTFSSIWDAPEGNAGTTLASNLPQILQSLSYINFHTTQFGGGEIRGQIFTPDSGSTGLLLGSAVAGLVTLRFRQLRKG